MHFANIEIYSFLKLFKHLEIHTLLGAGKSLQTPPSLNPDGVSKHLAKLSHL